MKITLPTASTMNGKWPDGNKEQVKAMQVIGIHNGAMVAPITARFHMSRSRTASVVYCSLWTHNVKTGHSFNGFGKAGGYGYHRESAALADALRSAGIEIDESISGRGDGVMREALLSIAREFGFEQIYMVEL